MNNMLPIAMNSLVVKNNDITPNRIIICVVHVQLAKKLQIVLLVEVFKYGMIYQVR